MLGRNEDHFNENIAKELKKMPSISIDNVFNTLKKVSSPYSHIFHNIITSPTLSLDQKIHNAVAIRNQLLDNDSIPWFYYKSKNTYKIGKSDEAILMKNVIKGLKRRENLKVSIMQNNQIAIEGETFSYIEG